MQPEDQIADPIEPVEAGLEAVQPAEGEVEPTPFEYPNQWNKDTRAAVEAMLGQPDGRKWADSIRKQWDEHDGRYRTTQAERDRYRSQADRWQQAIQPYEQQYRMLGMDPYAGVQQAIAWQAAIHQNPQQTLAQLAQMYGIQLGGQPAEDEPYVDPYVKQMKHEYDQKHQRVEGALSSIQNYFEQQKIEYAMQQIHAFATATDEDGTPKHPHLGEIPQDELVRLVNAGYSLDKAYSIACMSNDDVRAKMEQARAVKDAAARRVQAEKAQGALTAKSPAGKAGGTSARAPRTAAEAVDMALRELS